MTNPDESPAEAGPSSPWPRDPAAVESDVAKAEAAGSDAAGPSSPWPREPDAAEPAAAAESKAAGPASSGEDDLPPAWSSSSPRDPEVPDMYEEALGPVQKPDPAPKSFWPPALSSENGAGQEPPKDPPNDPPLPPSPFEGGALAGVSGRSQAGIAAESQAETPKTAEESGKRGKEDPPDEKPMTLLGHLGELRSRLLRAFIGVFLGFLLCYGFAPEIFRELARPLLAVMPPDAKFIYTGVAEGFFVDLKVGFMAALFVASPFVFYQIWAFVAPGLYEEEKRYLFPLSLLSACFFLGGAAFCYIIVFPFAFTFFLSYSTGDIVAMLSISEYLSFAIKMLIAFGLIFEMPLFAFFLSRMGLVTAQRMRNFRKYAVIAVFVAAAILTPPDVFSQLLMAAPMLILYEVSILVAALAGKREPKSPGDGDRGDSGDDPDGGASPNPGEQGAAGQGAAGQGAEKA